jgi:hypothetical protein
MFDMDVRGLILVTGVEEQPERPNSQYCRHILMLHRTVSFSNVGIAPSSARPIDATPRN